MNSTINIWRDACFTKEGNLRKGGPLNFKYLMTNGRSFTDTQLAIFELVAKWFGTQEGHNYICYRLFTQYEPLKNVPNLPCTNELTKDLVIPLASRELSYLNKVLKLFNTKKASLNSFFLRCYQDNEKRGLISL